MIGTHQLRPLVLGPWTGFCVASCVPVAIEVVHSLASLSSLSSLLWAIAALQWSVVPFSSPCTPDFFLIISKLRRSHFAWWCSIALKASRWLFQWRCNSEVVMRPLWFIHIFGYIRLCTHKLKLLGVHSHFIYLDNTTLWTNSGAKSRGIPMIYKMWFQKPT